MKVILIHDAPLNEWKGTQKALFELGNYLVQMGHTVTYLNNVSFKRSKTEKHLSFSKVPQFSIVDLEFRRFLGIWFIGRNILQQYKPDAIYIASLQSFYYIPFYKFNTLLKGTLTISMFESILNFTSGSLNLDVEFSKITARRFKFSNP